MKNLKLLLLSFLLIGLFSCDANLSLNTIKVDIINNRNEVSMNEELEISFRVRDSEGIEKVQIEIPVLSVDKTIDEFSDENFWESEEQFFVGETTVTGAFEIFTTVTDREGEVYMETDSFTISE
ncbi:MAG: hypothetical protein AB8G22_00095 [Saprospiraceae bacterium]